MFLTSFSYEDKLDHNGVHEKWSYNMFDIEKKTHTQQIVYALTNKESQQRTQHSKAKRSFNIKNTRGIKTNYPFKLEV